MDLAKARRRWRAGPAAELRCAVRRQAGCVERQRRAARRVRSGCVEWKHRAARRGRAGHVAERWRAVPPRVRAACRRCAAGVWKAVADGWSCRQQTCGRETVCQRDRSILNSPVTLVRPGHSKPASFPRLAGPKEPVYLLRSVRDSGPPSGRPRGTENARINPDSQPASAGRQNRNCSSA